MRDAKVEYDALSRKVVEIDPEGRRTEFRYDALNRLTKVILAADTAHATETVSAQQSALFLAAALASCFPNPGCGATLRSGSSTEGGPWRRRKHSQRKPSTANE